MKSFLARVSVSASVFAMTALPVLADGSRRGGYGVRQNVNHPVPPPHAGPPHNGGGVVHAPEIDASTGLLALAAVAVALVLVWELRRRRFAA